MDYRTCTIDGCAKKLLSRGMCSMHYSRLRKFGSTDKPKRNIGIDRFDSTYTVTESGCWEWTGSTTHNGYGQFYDGTGMVRAHRYSWERTNGPIPDGMVVDHLCHVRKCINPEHMRLLTTSENQQNRAGAQARNISGYRGVHWDKSRGKWSVSIGINGKYVYGGRYSDKDEAGRVAAALRAQHMPYTLN